MSSDSRFFLFLHHNYQVSLKFYDSYCKSIGWIVQTFIFHRAIKILAKKIDTMANVSIFYGNFFNWLEIEKYAFSFDIHPLLDQSTCGNNYHGNIWMVIITTGTLV